MSEERILLVDDEGELVFTLAERLELRGFKVDAVTSGKEAVALLETHAYDCAVFDVKMPGMGGGELLDQACRLQPDLPVIMLTGHGSPHEEEGLDRCQAAHTVLYKPVLLDTLLEAMRNAKRSPRYD
ncbi:MAG: hypothetical protein A2284_13805 [Deltaproteobacteria bacterium RIFOXYA12_FULL_61_11]|nr:MAG: hypothetical protein A2284_13805 [Deltaproteobacteria bacterium RIFOXYA12_FULL_61_11]